MKLLKIFKQSVNYFNSLVKVNSRDVYSSKELHNIEMRGYYEGQLEAYKRMRDYIQTAHLIDFNGKHITLPGDRFLDGSEEMDKIRKEYPLKRDSLRKGL